MTLPGRVAAGVLVAATSAASLAACGGGGGEGGGSLPTPTRSATLSPTFAPTFAPTRSPSAPERPTDTADTADPTSPAAPTQAPTGTTDPTRTTAPAPTPTSTVTVTEQASPSAPPPVATSPTASSPTTAPAAGDEAAGDEPSTPSWVWWLLAAAALALVVGIPLVVRARRRHGWVVRLAAGEAEAAWFARELVPELRRSSQSTERLAGAWSVGGADRVRQLEDDLTGLQATAPDDDSRGRAVRLRDAVRDGRQRLDALTVPGTVAVPGVELDLVAAGIEAALAPPQA